MHIFLGKLLKAEKDFENRPGTNQAVILIAYYRLCTTAGLDKESNFVQKAYHAALGAFNANKGSWMLLFDLIELSIESAYYDQAQELIKDAGKYKRWYKANKPEINTVLDYYQCKTLAASGKTVRARRLFKKLLAAYQKEPVANQDLMLADLSYCIYGKQDEALKYYAAACARGCRSVQLFTGAYRMLGRKHTIEDSLLPLTGCILKWCAAKKMEVGGILNALSRDGIAQALKTLDTQALEHIYKAVKNNQVLEEICTRLIHHKDLSYHAYTFYQRAVKAGYSNGSLDSLLIQSAYAYGGTKVPQRILENALEEEYFGLLEQPDMLAFIYHHLMAIYARQALPSKLEKDIMEFGFRAVAQNKKGQYYNSVYRYMFNKFPGDKVLSQIIFEDLFRYEITIQDDFLPKYILIHDNCKESVYFYAASGNKMIVSAIGEDFNIYFLDGTQSELVTIRDYTVFPLMPDKDHNLYEALYKNGFESPELLTALSLVYISQEILDEKEALILEKTVSSSGISEKLRFRIGRCLGRYYEQGGQYKKALRFYAYTGNHRLSPEDIQTMLHCYLYTKDFEKAAKLIYSGGAYLPDRCLSDSLKLLAGTPYDYLLAETAYHLLMNHWYSEPVKRILLSSFRGSISQWILIAKRLDSVGTETEPVYEKIIEKSIWTRQLTPEVQGAAVVLHGINPENIQALRFTYYCAYEVLKNDRELLPATVKMMEEVYSRYKNCIFIAYALTNCYVRLWPQYKHKEDFIQEAVGRMEKEKVLFPCLKDFQDKYFLSPYIEKNTPFIYHGEAGQKINLYIQFGGARGQDKEKGFLKAPMRYFRFGIYMVNIQLFYHEQALYYFEVETESQEEKQWQVFQLNYDHMRLSNQTDMYSKINNAVIYENSLRYDSLEALIEQEIERKEKLPMVVL